MNKVFNVFKIPELRKKLLIIFFIFFVFRILATIPIPGVNEAALSKFFSSSQMLGFLNMFSGGALSRLSIVMLGLGPYITATIIMQLLTLVFPNLKALYYEEGEQGRAKFNRYSRYLTVPLAAINALGFLKILASQGVLPAGQGFWITFTNVVVVTAGSMVMVWLGELITEQQMGNGISLLIFAGIVSGLPMMIRNAIATYTPTMFTTYLSFLVLSLVITVAIVVVNEGVRKVPISYARRVRGNKLYGGVSSYLPIRVNQAGVIPIIFAVSVLMFPQVLAQMVTAFSENIGLKLHSLVMGFSSHQVLYGAVYFFLVFIFTYFYTAVTFDPKEISKNLQRSGGFVPGIRPGVPTATFIQQIITRITLFGALFLGLIAILPLLVQAILRTNVLTIGGVALLIAVEVTLESANQIDSQLTIREYEGIR
ncbi:MAG: preprotein translocase subunit SecY [bacterium]